MFVYVTIPDLELRVAMGMGRSPGSDEEAAALDPGGDRQGSRHRRTGKVNRAARLRGVRPGMPVGLALDLCPGLRLLRPDPVRAAHAWEERVRQIEGIGAEVESPGIGDACFDPSGLLPLYGDLRGLLERVFEAMDDECLVGVGPSRLAASIDLAASPEDVEVIPHENLRERLDPLPLESLRGRIGAKSKSEEELITSLRRVGVDRLGELRRLGRGPVADRFGTVGATAWEVATGREEPLRPRKPGEEVRVVVEIPDHGSSFGLSPALGLVCSRLAAKLEGLGRAARSLRLEADLADGGSWCCERSPKLPTASADLIRLLFGPALELIPGIPAKLGMVAITLAEAEPEGATLFDLAGESRRRKLDEAVRQVRAVVGDRGLLKVVEASPRSRLPERRVMLIPRDVLEP